MTIVEKIENLIMESGITQKAFAERAGIKPTTLNSILRNDIKNIKLDTLRGICKAFDVTLDYLMDDSVADKEEGKYWDVKLSGAEGRLVTRYRILDTHGREIVDVILDKEITRMRQLEEEAKRKAKIVPLSSQEGQHNEIDWPLADREASAGRGVYLDGESFHIIRVDADRLPRNASFGIVVNGDSMEPFFSDRDIVMVAARPAEKGEIGIFVQDEEGYIKKHGGTKLISLNNEYAAIPLNESIRNMGTVIGVLDPTWIIEG